MFRAYFFGELSPARKPRYYVHLINQLFSLFMSGIRGDGEVPLIINTCGWTKCQKSPEFANTKSR